MNTQSQSAPTKRPRITKDVVKHAAIAMIAAGKITTLDVKKELRSKNFHAVQADVSKYLQELQVEEGWDVTNNGVYNEYTLKTAKVATTVSNNTSSVSARVIELVGEHTDEEVEENSLLRSNLDLDILEVVEVLDDLETQYDIKFKNGTANEVQTVKDIIDATTTLMQARPNHTAAPVAPVVNAANTNGTQMVRKPRAVINDSAHPSSDPKVKINIDPKNDVGHMDVTKIKATCHAKDWVLSVVGNPSFTKIYDEKYTRDNVRTAFTRLVGQPYINTRACRVENLI